MPCPEGCGLQLGVLTVEAGPVPLRDCRKTAFC